MPWLQLRINCARDNADQIETALEHSECLAVTLEDNADQPIFEPKLGETPLWQETRVTGLFEADINTHAVSTQINSFLGELQVEHIWRILEDKDWEREWMSHYSPIKCSDKLWICPSWTPPPDPNATNLMLDPGLAFGTGTHPTTFLCLQWLSLQSLDNKNIVDYGCGSGILGIAALLLGAKNVKGTDIDPQALLATQENAKRNNLHPETFPVYYPSHCPSEPVDVVLANILAGPLVELAPTLINLIKPNGLLCLSGLLASQKDSIITAYQDAIDITDILEKDEWICVTGRRKTGAT